MKSVEKDVVIEPLPKRKPDRIGSWSRPICDECGGVMAWHKTDGATVVCAGVTRRGVERELHCLNCCASSISAVFYRRENDHE